MQLVLFVILLTSLFPSDVFSEDYFNLKKDSLTTGEIDTTISTGQGIEFQTFRILTQLSEEPDFIRDRLYEFQYELGIQKGKELELLEIYIDKTPKNMNMWNVIISDTAMQFSLPWNNLSESSRDLLDNWSGRNDIARINPDDIDTIVPKKNEMFIVRVYPLMNMGEDSKLSNLQKDYTYEIIIIDDYPEQVEIQPNRDLIIKRVDSNRFRLKLARFNRASFERWADGRNDDPYVFTTRITLYDKETNITSKPVNLRFTFGEY